MIDVWGVLANTLWIVGLALILAVLSWAYWLATSGGERLPAMLARPGLKRLLNSGLVLIGIGLAVTWIV